MLEIIIDGTPIFPKPSGVGFYVANLIGALSELEARENFKLGITYQPGFKDWLFGRWEFPESLQKYQNSRHFFPLPVRVTNLFIDRFSELFSLGLAKISKSPDIVHGTNYTVFPFQKSLRVMTVYDLSFKKYPGFIDSTVKQYDKRVRKCMEWTDLILTISENSKKDIIEYLNVDPSKVIVTYIASRYHSNYLSGKDLEQLKQSIQYNFSRPYILFVSTIEPRKNITGLLEAFHYLKKERKLEHDLILVGKKGWLYQPIFEAIDNSPWRQHIHHLDYSSDDSVALLYSRADVFVYPSHYEGFGLPVLEAMTLGAPVVTANTSSLPEVAGDAALQVAPDRPLQIAEAIYEIITNSSLRNELIQKGKERAKLFSWEKTAKDTLAAYKSFL